MSGQGRGVKLSPEGVTKITLDVDNPLLARIDSVRECPRARWIREACEMRLSSEDRAA